MIAMKPPVYLDPPCQACGAEHRLVECHTEQAARLLDGAGLELNAARVRRRVRGAR